MIYFSRHLRAKPVLCGNFEFNEDITLPIAYHLVRKRIPAFCCYPHARTVLMTRSRNQIPRKFAVAMLGTMVVVVSAPAEHRQEGRWASKDDPVAKRMIEMERNWAEDGSKQKGAEESFLADDFQGT